MFAALASSPPMTAVPAPRPPPPRSQISPAVYRAARNGAKRQQQMRPRANTISCSSPRGSVTYPSPFTFNSTSTSLRRTSSVGLNALSLSPGMGPQVVGSIGHSQPHGRRFTISGDEMMSDRERRRVHRTLSLHGRDLFATVMSASEGSTSPRNSPRMSPQMTYYGGSTEVAQVEEEEEEVEDDGWATVPTKKQKAKKREVKRQDRVDNPSAYADNEQQQQQQQGSWYDDHFEHDDAVELYYEHANTANSRQVGSSKKSNQFKAAAKRSFAIDKRNKQRGR